MARSAPYRRAISDAVNWRQEQALGATIFILREIGPTGFLLQEEGVQAQAKVLIGDPHHCSCADFRKDRDLCRHICWLLLRRFRLDRDDPLSWQAGLVEREINGLLAMRHAARGGGADGHKRAEKPPATAAPSDGTTDYPAAQRPISEEDVCPICQEELLASRLPVTYCRLTCGNSIHMRCMHVWASHQKQQGLVSGGGGGGSGGGGNISCPMCRGDFAPYALLMQELGNASAAKAAVVQGHRVACTGCGENPIVGKCYRCSVCRDCHLCQRCFNSPQVHPQQHQLQNRQHAFQFRERPGQQWRQVDRLAGVGLPLSVAGLLQSRPGDFGEADYEALMALDAPAAGSQLTDAALARLRHWTVARGHALTRPGRQCPLCLMAFVPGQAVRQLAPCRHVVHAACIDPLLLHRSCLCPLDGLEVKPPPPPITDQPATSEAGDKSKSRRGQPAAAAPGIAAGAFAGLQLSGSRLLSSPARLPPLPPQAQRQRPQGRQPPPQASAPRASSGRSRSLSGGSGGGPRGPLNLELTAVHL